MTTQAVRTPVLNRPWLTRLAVTVVATVTLSGASALGQAPKITGKDHMGQEKVNGVLMGYTSGNVTEYAEGDPINFRFTLETNDPGMPPAQFVGQMEVRFSLESATCTFFDPMFTLGTHDASAPAVEVISGAAPTVTLNGVPFADGTEWVQIIDIVFDDPDSEARVNYWLKVADDIGNCMGASQHSRLDESDTPGMYMQTGAQNVPVPANMIIRIGACCFPDGSCQELSEEECDDASGDYQGDDTGCDPNLCPQPMGACCFPDGSCQQLTEEDCDAAGGDFQGDFTSCNPNPCPQPPGACCLPDGSCDELTEEDCDAAGGDFQGDFTTCDPNPCVRACCLPDGACEDLTVSDCENAGGAPGPAGVLCEDIQCPSNDTCKEAVPIAAGKTPFSNIGASTDGPIVCGIGADIWFEYVAPSSGILKVLTCYDTDFDTVIAIYDSCGCPAMTSSLVECNDDFCGLQSKVAIDVCAGECYLIQVGGYNGAMGFGVLKLIEILPDDCGDEDAGNCFNAPGQCNPFCNNEKCCNLICGIDPFCCTVTWDHGCVDLALQHCGDCGGADAGNCYAANGSPGCNDADCCQAVCQVDPACCHVTWDTVCADEAEAICQGEPIPCPGEGSCRAANGSPGCEDQECCELICSLDPSCCAMEWDQDCADQAIELCPNIGGCPGDGDCFIPNGSPGCDDETCCEVVCDKQPACCTIDWDQQCADMADSMCVVICPGEGDCYASNGTPGCDDEDCCKEVCAYESYCCLVQWDDYCVYAAEKVCDDKCPCDLNQDGEVGVADVLVVIMHWADPCPAGDIADVNLDGAVNTSDFIQVLFEWGGCF